MVEKNYGRWDSCYQCGIQTLSAGSMTLENPHSQHLSHQGKDTGGAIDDGGFYDQENADSRVAGKMPAIGGRNSGPPQPIIVQFVCFFLNLKAVFVIN
jgi:hypothetical protein